MQILDFITKMGKNILKHNTNQAQKALFVIFELKKFDNVLLKFKKI